MDEEAQQSPTENSASKRPPTRRPEAPVIREEQELLPYPATSFLAVLLGIFLAAIPFLLCVVAGFLGERGSLGEPNGVFSQLAGISIYATSIPIAVVAVYLRTGVVSSIILATLASWYAFAAFFLWMASDGFEGGLESLAIAAGSVLGAVVFGPLLGVCWGCWNRRLW